MSEGLVEEWIGRYGDIAAGNRRRLDLLQRLLSACDQHGLAVLPVKGTDLLLRGYRGLGFRPMYDSDWLVHREDLPAVRQLLEENGFTLSRSPEKIWTASFFNESFDYVSADGEFTIDLQWDFWFLPEIDRFWERASVHQTAIGPRLLLHPEDALLTQVAEVTGRRGWLSPFLPQDIQALLEAQGNQIDWTRWAARVRELGMAPVVGHGLTWSVEKGLKGVPVSVLETLRPISSGESLRRALLQRLISTEAAPKVQYALHAVALPDNKSRARMLKRALWPDRAWREERLGRPLRAFERLAFMTRPLRLAWRALFILPKELRKLLRN